MASALATARQPCRWSPAGGALQVEPEAEGRAGADAARGNNIWSRTRLTAEQ